MKSVSYDRRMKISKFCVFCFEHNHNGKNDSMCEKCEILEHHERIILKALILEFSRFDYIYYLFKDSPVLKRMKEIDEKAGYGKQ